ncbi:MAG: ferredoxin reductase [Actinomycetota bacterium]|nr:ferredoxin reductase [Actinomycetota bacterium]
MPATTTTSRLLRSGFVDLLVGPHGIDRYLELIRPQMTVRDARAEVIGVHRQTDRSVTLTLRPNRVWSGHLAGQFVRVGIEIDGVRRTRTYSPACSERGSRDELELTVTEHPEGRVSGHLVSRVRPGTIVHLAPAQGDFVLPQRRPERLVLISGGSGITPVLSMLRTLCHEGHEGEIAFLHYARTAADFLYRAEVDALAATHPGLHVQYVATREGGDHVSAEAIVALLPGAGPDGAHAAVCGPPALIDAVGEIYAGAPERLFTETFTPPVLTVSGQAGTAGEAGGEGTIRFLRSDRVAEIGEGTLLEQAESSGLTPEFGCRMGICHTCTCRKSAGTVRNLLTGEISDEEDEDIQLCISVPAGDVALEI